MARYHCDKVSEQLQQIEGVRVTDMTRSSWRFEQNKARINLRVLPGCCGVLLVYQLSGPERDLFRLLRCVLSAAKKANFGVVFMSLRSDSRLRALLGQDWTATKFKNPRTKNDVELLSFTITYRPKREKLRPQVHEDE